VADPDFEIRIDPGPGVEMGQSRGGSIFTNCLTDALRRNTAIGRIESTRGQTSVETAEELLAAVEVMFPGILAIKNDGYEDLVACRML
jgi:hypothetical protein